MTDHAIALDDTAHLPSSMSVAVIMQCTPTDNPWIDNAWTAVGVTGDTHVDAEKGEHVRVINEQAGVRHILHSGFNISLHVDECESYYHNLKSPEPGCYVIARNDDEDIPVPYLVTLSFDEANAYLECEDIVFPVAMPPEIYRWMEGFVLQHYVPEKRVKRKRNNWKKSADTPQGQPS